MSWRVLGAILPILSHALTKGYKTTSPQDLHSNGLYSRLSPRFPRPRTSAVTINIINSDYIGFYWFLFTTLFKRNLNHFIYIINILINYISWIF
ncbi:hypothetical protein QBC38DRAFT_13591 [Podospora fimiseda]|uniref:Uncharacterized protein n=1 Tax=Podospora fimiseda TaxID=252190 RepID=A0AAN7GUE3_9PEZI|nr:hypothetical protein QBC38DRAFT_13591 [Podospora fimiseda]